MPAFKVRLFFKGSEKKIMKIYYADCLKCGHADRALKMCTSPIYILRRRGEIDRERGGGGYFLTAGDYTTKVQK